MGSVRRSRRPEDASGGDVPADLTGKSGGQSAVGCLPSAFVIYQDPLAYLLGLEGIALLDAWTGDHDRAFTDARLAEIRELLDAEKLRDRGVYAERVSAVLAYQQRAAGYDAAAGGGLFATDEPVVAEYLSGRQPGVALDAACGTGSPGRGSGHRSVGQLPTNDPGLRRGATLRCLWLRRSG